MKSKGTMKGASHRCWNMLLLLAGLLAASAAAADAVSARAALVANLERLHYDAAPEAAAAVDDRTLVDGLYRLEDPATGQLIALYTASADVIGDGTGWKWIDDSGLKPFSPEEVGRLRAEAMRSIEWKRLVEVRYGDGGGRRILLISAVNCPVCARMEKTLAQHAASIDTTFYLLPISLSPSAAEGYGEATWRQASAIWCAADGAAAWRQFWLTHQAPAAAAGCTRDAMTTFKTSRNFATVLASIGAPLRGTPGIVREDGTALAFPAEPDAAWFSEVLGAKALQAFKSPQGDTAPRQWLAAH